MISGLSGLLGREKESVKPCSPELTRLHLVGNLPKKQKGFNLFSVLIEIRAEWSLTCERLFFKDAQWGISGEKEQEASEAEGINLLLVFRAVTPQRNHSHVYKPSPRHLSVVTGWQSPGTGSPFKALEMKGKQQPPLPLSPGNLSSQSYCRTRSLQLKNLLEEHTPKVEAVWRRQGL